MPLDVQAKSLTNRLVSDVWGCQDIFENGYTNATGQLSIEAPSFPSGIIEFSVQIENGGGSITTGIIPVSEAQLPSVSRLGVDFLILALIGLAIRRLRSGATVGSSSWRAS